MIVRSWEINVTRLLILLAFLPSIAHAWGMGGLTYYVNPNYRPPVQTTPSYSDRYNVAYRQGWAVAKRYPQPSTPESEGYRRGYSDGRLK